MKKPIKHICDISIDIDVQNNSNFSNSKYIDEPIVFPASKIKNYLPEKYKLMKKIADNFDYYTDTEASVFYDQAKFMEDYEDDFEYNGKFIRAFPTYRVMNDEQLRGYFSFRTRVRKGEIVKTSTSFAYVYCYELINGIGVKNIPEGYNMLLEFCKSYREVDEEFGDYYIQWLNDYVIYYNLDKHLLSNVGASDFDTAFGIITNFNSVSDKELFEALDSLSSYHYSGSVAYKNFPEDMRRLTCNVFKAVVDFYNRNCQKSFLETAFGKVLSGHYILFKAAVFCDLKKYTDYSYKISETLKYTCQNGHWSRERLFGYRTQNKELGILFKSIDAVFRKHLGVKPEIKRITENKLYFEIIQNELLKLNDIKRQRRLDSIKIDLTILDNIRESAEKIKDKLIVDCETEDFVEIKKKEEIIENEPEGLEIPGVTNPILDDTCIYFLNMLLRGENPSAELKKRGVMVSVLADEINEILFDEFGDALIEFNGEEPVILEDYKKQLKEMLNL